jgi:tRNA1Val (adenine37-N6)-methyltransferase
LEFQREIMKSGTHFHFKKFSIAHDRCIHKVGTDGVLLGAWVDITGCKNILDIGTGSGVIALMLAQRTDENVKIDAIEIEKQDADQAIENVNASSWRDRITIHNMAVQNFSPPDQYDLIVSNPPYFVKSYLPPNERRTQARHTSSLSFEELLSCAMRLLKNNGRLAIILPDQEGLQFISLAAQLSLYCNRKSAFRTRRHKPVERWLLEFSSSKTRTTESEILLYEDQSDQWSADYKALTKDFYLKI